MCDPQVLLAFVVACAALILTPGPSQALILSRTLEGGRAAGMFTAVGINAATLVHAAAAGLGLSAVLAQSALAFGALKVKESVLVLLPGAVNFFRKRIVCMQLNSTSRTANHQ